VSRPFPVCSSMSRIPLVLQTSAVRTAVSPLWAGTARGSVTTSCAIAAGARYEAGRRWRRFFSGTSRVTTDGGTIRKR
jgi:hypothetical protein